MPRAYNEQERAAIRDQLMRAGESRFAGRGVRKTSIDELVADAGIGKGSFYQFFGSKEELFFALLEQIESQAKSELALLAKRRRPPHKMVVDFFRLLAEQLSRNRLLNLLTDKAEFEHLVRNLAPQQLAEHQKKDQEFFQRLFLRWKRGNVIRNTSPDSLVGIVTLIFLMHQHRERFGSSFDGTLELVIDSICNHIAGPS